MYAVVVVRVGVERFPTPVDHRMGIRPVQLFSFTDRDVTQFAAEKGFRSFFESHGYFDYPGKSRDWGVPFCTARRRKEGFSGRIFHLFRG